MSRISAEDAFRTLAEWSEQGKRVQVLMTQDWRQQGANVSLLNKVLPHSEKVLATLRDENGSEISVTLNLAGAEWERDPDAGADVAETKPANRVIAAFPNGNRYAFGESTESAAGGEPAALQ